MANKQFQLTAELPVTIYKRRRSRHLRLSVAPGGQVRVSIPTWVPYKVGMDFAKSRQEWILSQQTVRPPLKHGQLVGKAHHLTFGASPVAKPTSRVTATTIVVRYPMELSYQDEAIQRIARTASIKALRLQAEQLLPQRLAVLAKRHGFSYHSVGIKKLKGRWGSCDQHANITLSLYLMQLSWELIDYVILHELTHTQVLRHGPDFWAVMRQLTPELTRLRKGLRQQRAVI